MIYRILFQFGEHAAFWGLREQVDPDEDLQCQLYLHLWPHMVPSFSLTLICGKSSLNLPTRIKNTTPLTSQWLYSPCSNFWHSQQMLKKTTQMKTPSFFYPYVENFLQIHSSWAWGCQGIHWTAKSATWTSPCYDRRTRLGTFSDCKECHNIEGVS